MKLTDGGVALGPGAQEGAAGGIDGVHQRTTVAAVGAAADERVNRRDSAEGRHLENDAEKSMLGIVFGQTIKVAVSRLDESTGRHAGGVVERMQERVRAGQRHLECGAARCPVQVPVARLNQR